MRSLNNILSILLTIVLTNIVSGQVVPNKLAGRFIPPTQSTIENYEFSEVLSTITILHEESTDIYQCRIFASCNGPADPEYEGCNCSINYYIANAQFDLPPDYKLLN